MGFLPFLLTRISFIAAYAGFALLSITIIQLDLRLSNERLHLCNMLYLALLGIVILAIFLITDYRRWSRYLRYLVSAPNTESLDQLGLLPSPVTYEQHVFSHAWAALYARLRVEVENERHKGQRNVKLVSQWAHHMKTPVSVIDLELQKAAKQALPQNITDVLNSINEENLRLQNSLQTLLNMVRLEDFNVDFRIETVDLDALVRRLVNDYKRAFIVHKVYPKVEMPAMNSADIESCAVQTDPKWLRFVLEQILNNAVKYSSGLDHEGMVVFRCFRNGNAIVLEVADNGIGIAPEDLGRIFQPFYTGVNGRSYPQSTGMGLYLARETCLRLGHQLSIAGKLGQGTQVQLHFYNDQTTHAGLQLH